MQADNDDALVFNSSNDYHDKYINSKNHQSEERDLKDTNNIINNIQDENITNK